MSNAIEHFSRHRVHGTTLQVMADTQDGLDRLIGEELSVIECYAGRPAWPHQWVNMFVLADLQPLIAQISGAARLSAAVAEDIDRRPMVNVYDAANLSECTLFVNRGALAAEAAWDDAASLRALLAHEHAHALAEGRTVSAARELRLAIAGEDGTIKPELLPILELLGVRLCLQAPQEVLANEAAIRAGFGRALFYLDKRAIDKAAEAIGQRALLRQRLERQAAQGGLRPGEIPALLLVGDLQAHGGYALETAPFLRAGQAQQAGALEAALTTGILAHLDPGAGALYRRLRDHYGALQPDWPSADAAAWAAQALALLAGPLREKGLGVRFDLAQRPAGRAGGGSR